MYILPFRSPSRHFHNLKIDFVGKQIYQFVIFPWTVASDDITPGKKDIADCDL
jgi:hypothetical protein